MQRPHQLFAVRIATMGSMIVVTAFLIGCPSAQRTISLPTLSWSITSTKGDGTVSNIPVESGTAIVDPTAALQIKLLADSPSGISAMTLKGFGDVNCQARVSAEKDSPIMRLIVPALDLGTQSKTVNPPAAPHSVVLTFMKQNSVQDGGIIRCSPRPEIVNGVIRYYDAWSGTLTFTGSASDAATPPATVREQLIVDLAPPTP